MKNQTVTLDTKVLEQPVGALEDYVNNDDVDLHLNGIKQKALAALANIKKATL